jgi:vacuolar protein sorting-associated protein 41
MRVSRIHPRTRVSNTLIHQYVQHRQCLPGMRLRATRFILSKTGQTKRALFLIIDKLGDVSQAIQFVKEQDDQDLWDNLLDYSMDKPRFIRGLLEEVGTSIDPITLVRRIPEGLEIEGLREGIGRMVREYEIQHSISDGVARVLRGEVATGMDQLRAGQKRGVKFDIVDEEEPLGLEVLTELPDTSEHDEGQEEPQDAPEARSGCCVKCGKPFPIDGKSNDISTLFAWFSFGGRG